MQNAIKVRKLLILEGIIVNLETTIKSGDYKLRVSRYLHRKGGQSLFKRKLLLTGGKSF